MFRWFALAVLVGCLGISTYYRHRARLESETIPRRREGALFAARALLGLPLLIAIVAHVVIPERMAWALLATLGLMWFVVGPREEAHLLARLGDAYRAYSPRTGRLLPRLTRPT